MKTPFVFRVLALASLLTALLAAPPEAAAQTMRTNDVPLPFASITAAANSNILTFANSGGYAAAAAIPIQAPALGITFYWQFSCATVTLANASVVLQGSADNTVWPTQPGGAGCFTISTGASAASANNTNVVVATNLTQAQIGPYRYFRVAGGTNGNAANITAPRLTASWW